MRGSFSESTTTPDENWRRGDSYSNQCRVTKACVLSRVAMRERLRQARAKQAKKKREGERKKNPRAIRWFMSSPRSIRSLFARRCSFCIARARGKGREFWEGKRDFVCLHGRTIGSENGERPRNRVHSRNVVLRITKHFEPASAGESGALGVIHTLKCV